MGDEGPGILALDRPGQTAFCSFLFRDDAFSTARDWLERDARTSDVVVIDEVSKLEASGKGHHDTIRHALALNDVVVVLCIRADQLFYVVERFDLEDDAVAVMEIPADDETVASFVSDVAASAVR